jgi:hypothetical protein
MRKGDFITERKLKEDGFTHLFNFGGWEVWYKGNIRLYWSRPHEKIEHVWVHGQLQ